MTLTDTDQSELIAAARKGCCPGCGFDKLIAGPWGGASRNVYCAQCHSIWNLHGINYGIVRVDFEGPCTDSHIAHAMRTYPQDQPFKGVADGPTANRDTEA